MLSELKREFNYTYTENGAKVHSTTDSYLLDFFAQAGAMRNRSENEVIAMFTKAFAEDSLLALKALFYFRDIRGGGQGERRTFRIILKYLANHHTKVMEKNINLIPHYGRWDDMYELVDTKLEELAFDIMFKQFIKDIQSENPSLLGKWLKSENASSYETKRLAKKTRKSFNLTPKIYRKTLSKLRKKIDVVERKMTSKDWSEIDYEKVPSQAGLKYRNAFMRNDEVRFEEYINNLSSGNAKINVKDLFPYEIIRNVTNIYNREDQNNDKVLNEMWNNLPDYFDGIQENSLAVVDTSGSMTVSGGNNVTPINVALSVGLYTAERNKGLFHNHFITFSSRPHLQKISGNTITEKVNSMVHADWEMTTNIKAVFDLILNTAVKNNITKEEMVKKLYIISDMEFDICAKKPDEYLFDSIRESYQENGYEMPKLVFWNVDARNQQFPMTMNDEGVQLVSGCNPSIFKNLLKDNFMNPYDLMLDVLMDERYSLISV